MSGRASQKKFVGTAGALSEYYAETMGESALKTQKYYDLDQDHPLFTNLGGKMWDRLFEPDEERVLTRIRHARIHNGKKFDGTRITQGNYGLVWEKDENGREIRKLNPETNKLERIPVMVPITESVKDADGNDIDVPVMDPLTGKPKMKQDTEDRTVAGIDLTMAWDKSLAELMIQYPEYAPIIEANALAAADDGMRYLERNALTVVRTQTVNGIQRKTRHTAELCWVTVFGAATRPTELARERGYEADAHPHSHTFLFASAFDGESYRKVDSYAIFKMRAEREAVTVNSFNRRMEDSGFVIDYSEPDRKGNIRSYLAGSNPDAREYLSTRQADVRRIRKEFRSKYGRGPTDVETRTILARTKLKKTKAAKLADEFGSVAQNELWANSLAGAGIKLTMRPQGAPVERLSFEERRAELIRRLELPQGVAIKCDASSLIHRQDVKPAVLRLADGLGLTTEELEALADDYVENVMEERITDSGNKLYTTQTLLAAERFVMTRLEELSARKAWAAPKADLEAVLRMRERRDGYSLDPEQMALVRAVCGPQRVVHGIGAAGAGKTAALAPAVGALKRSSSVDKVVVVSAARRRGSETAKSVRADHGWSVEALQNAVESGTFKPTDRTLVLIDEVAMINTFQMAEILHAIGDARLVTIGDTYQLEAIGPSGWLQKEQERRTPIRLEKNYRQKNPEHARDLKLIREGDARQAVTNMVKRGEIIAVPEKGDVPTKVRERYAELSKSHSGVVVLNTGSNSVLDDVNAAIQEWRITEGDIKADKFFSVHQEDGDRDWTLYEGDRIIFNEGFYPGKGLAPVFNGDMGIITKINDQGHVRVRLDEIETVKVDAAWAVKQGQKKTRNREVWLNLKATAHTQPIAPAYCMSTNKFQGNEIDATINLPGSPEITTLHTFYSTMSRHTKHAEVIVSYEAMGPHPAHALGEAASRSEERRMASELREAIEARRVDEVEEQTQVKQTPAELAKIELAKARETLEQSQSHGISY